ncbi:MAG: transglutaminase domain-containing protein [Lachnospiraceae bacterium]|nr:transglutaminase domain-containing protein [Lachnospiraceae bacterium]
MNIKKPMVLLAVIFMVSGCGKSPGEAKSPEVTQEIREEVGTPLQQAGSGFTVVEPGSIYKGSIEIATPEASGSVTYEGSGVTIDASHTEDGYVMVKCDEADVRLKVRITLGEDFYTYNLNQDGEYEVFPLQMGNGNYQVQVYKQVEGTTYSPLYGTELSVEMPDGNRVFMYPSQYIWYTNDKNAIKLSYDLCGDLTSDQEKVDRIYNYVVGLLTYDYEKAETVDKGYVPDVDRTLEERKGICFDYSALFAAMLRAQDIPVRLVMGNVQPENIYHAWNQVYVNGKWVWMDATFGPDSGHEESNYTQEREY